MAFKKRTADTAVPTDPEQLYRTLGGAPGAPAALWVHQGDVLRDWHQRYADSSDVAFELPTGAGKTLVGGLIGEYRRRTSDWRVVYLCRTRQLARQTHAKLRSYGLPAVLLVGKVRTWNAADRALYTSGEAVAVTVYSHVFNSNPAFDDAHMLIMDDAHAAEDTVAGPWSIDVPRESSAYHDVLSALSNAFDPLVLSRLTATTPDGHYYAQVYLASPVGLAGAAAQLEATISLACSSHVLPDARYAMQLMAGHLGRCMVYATYSRILIRPLIAPTATHIAFDAPAQRLYMSATLGAGGELERSFGRPQIERIPAPKGWDRQGTGRRFFCFPELTTDLSQTEDERSKWIAETIKRAGRAIVMTPDNRTATRFQTDRLAAGTNVVSPEQIEDDLAVFTGQDAAALVLANRYDGVDLPDDDCRLVILQGLPARGDLQERFLHSSLGSLEVLQERIRARIVQGAGRATRNAGDYAAVLIFGDDLTSFATRSDVLAAMHPEVHAEIRFGFEQSLGITSSEMTDNITAFLAQNEAWREVDKDIASARDHLDRSEPPGALELAASAPLEVAATLAAWQGEWDRALNYAKQVIDALRGGKAPQRYAALWNYLASCWALHLAEQTDDDSLRRASVDYYGAARAAGRGTSWLSHLAPPVDRAASEAASDTPDPLDITAATNILEALPTIGRPSHFDDDASSHRVQLLAVDPSPYEAALTHLGRLLGADPSEGNRNATAAPDSIWIFNPQLWLCWEAKSDAEPEGELGTNDVKQAGGHLRYASTRRGQAIPSGSIVALVTPQQRTHPTATAVAEEHVYLVRPGHVIDLYDRAIRAWRSLRANGGRDPSLEQVLDIFAAEGGLPSQWLAGLTQQPLAPSTLF